MTPGTAQNAAAQSFLLTPYLVANKNFLACCTNTHNNTAQWIDLENDNISSLSLKPSNLELLVNQFINANY